MCSSISGAKALKKMCLQFAIFNFSEKLQTEHFCYRNKHLPCIFFGNKIKKYGVIVQKLFLKKKYIEIKKFTDMFFIFYMSNKLLSNLRAMQQIPFDL